MWLLNLGKPTNVPPMNEAMAIELGANLLGEGILFIIAAALLIFEYSRQSASAERKEKALQQQLDELRYMIREVSLTQEQQSALQRELFRQVYDIDSRVVKIPWPKKENPYEDKNEPIPSLKDAKNVVNNQDVINEALSYIKTVYKPRTKEIA